MLEFIGFVALIIISKFIYDTYLTDNTERSFNEFRNTNPIEAAEIEPPQTKEQFDHLVNHLINQEENLNLGEEFSDFIEKVPNMEIKVSTPTDLLLSVNIDNEVFCFIIHQTPDFYNHFGGFLITENDERLNAETVNIGRLTDIEEKSPNWDSLVQNIILDIDLEKTKRVWQKEVESKNLYPIQTSGYYIIYNIDGKGATQVFRFYNDKTVIHVSLMGDIKRINTWFNKQSNKEVISKGSYELHGKFIIGKIDKEGIRRKTFIGFTEDDKSIKMKVDGRWVRKADFYPINNIIDEKYDDELPF